MITAERYTYELKIVLAKPEGERITIKSVRKRSLVFADAKKLAEFLGKPLLDHT